MREKGGRERKRKESEERGDGDGKTGMRKGKIEKYTERNKT